MSAPVLVAVPSEAPGGLEAAPSAHFGHCACYTIIAVEDGAIISSQVEPNQGHESGGCVQPVRELAKKGVKILLAGGMGAKPLGALHEMGIKVFHCQGKPTVEAALKAFAAGELPEFGKDQLCRGCGGHH